MRSTKPLWDPSLYVSLSAASDRTRLSTQRWVFVDTETDAAIEAPSVNANEASGGILPLARGMPSRSMLAEDIVAWWASGLPMNSVRPSSW